MPKKITTEEFTERARKVHGDRYDYSLVEYKSSQVKVKIICRDHGVFEQKPNNHLTGQGCPKCAIDNRSISTEEFIERASKVHGDRYDYSLVEYKRSQDYIKIICRDHGVFEQKPNNHLTGQGCPKCAGKNENLLNVFIKKAKKVHGNKYDYSRVKYVNNKTKVEIICPIHGSFWQTPNNHINSGHGCPECAGNKKYTTDTFIEKAREIHGDKYDYSLVMYVNNINDIKIICMDHGVFKQKPVSHLQGNGCPECAGTKKYTTDEFVKRAMEIHGNKYDYSRVEYVNNKTKVEIICPIHGSFWQTPEKHLSGHKCPKCAGKYEKSYTTNNIPVYDKYESQISPYGIKCRRNKNDRNILEVKCVYCDRWFIPNLISVLNKIASINGKTTAENNLYCSDHCKKACPTYGRIKYPKDFKINTSREVQPSLRKIVLERDNYTCQKCGATDVELHCHHYEGVKINPIESADMDNCITVCKKCHNEIHRKEKCGTKDYKC